MCPADESAQPGVLGLVPVCLMGMQAVLTAVHVQDL